MFPLAPYLMVIAMLKSTYAERIVLITQNEQHFDISVPLEQGSVVNDKKKDMILPVLVILTFITRSR